MMNDKTMILYKITSQGSVSYSFQALPNTVLAKNSSALPIYVPYNLGEI